ncbi:hypothetical protein Tco_0215403 [Tanacetum coccineum]
MFPAIRSIRSTTPLAATRLHHHHPPQPPPPPSRLLPHDSPTSTPPSSSSSSPSSSPPYHLTRFKFVTYLATPEYGDISTQAHRVEEETYETVGTSKQALLDAERKVVQIILHGIVNDIYSTGDACPNAQCSGDVESYRTIDARVSEDNTLGPMPQRQMTFKQNSSSLAPKRQHVSHHNSSEPEIQDHSNEPSNSTLVPEVVPTADTTQTAMTDLDILFSPMFDEYFNGGNQGVSKSSAHSDNHQQDTSPQLNVQPTSEPSTLTTNVNAAETTTIKK